MRGTRKIKEIKIDAWNKKDNGDMAISIRDKTDCSKCIRNLKQETVTHQAPRCG